MHSRDVIAKLEAAGWVEAGGRESTVRYVKNGKGITFPADDYLTNSTVRSLEKGAGVKLLP